MRSMQWQLGMLGTISVFAYRQRETERNLCRGGRSQDLPSTDFQPAVRHLKQKKKQYTHSTTNTHKITTTIHARQLQQYTRPTNNNYTQYNLKLATIHTRQIRIHVQKVKTPKLSGVLRIVSCNPPPKSLIHSRFHHSPSFLITSLRYVSYWMTFHFTFDFSLS